MNRGDVDLHSVHYHPPQLQHSTARSSLSASNRDIPHSDPEYAGDTESVSTVETVVRWETPPERQTQDLEHTQSEATAKPLQRRMDISVNGSGQLMTAPLDKAQLRAGVAAALRRPATILHEFNSAPPTPNNDDTPFIMYALNQLTRDRNVEPHQRSATETTLSKDDSHPVERFIPEETVGHVQPHKGLGRLQSVERIQVPPVVDIKPVSAHTDLFIPVGPQMDSPRYPALNFKPRILRPFFMIMLLLLCSMMVVILIFCAIYSSLNRGLVDYAGSIKGSQYFLFQFLPQILAAAIQLYLEAVISAVARIVPFAMMASDNSHQRHNALFVGLYSRSLLLPRFDYLSKGEPFLGICILLLWPVYFTIPLQSCLFSVIYVDGIWRWTAVHGVVWTLVTIYIMALISLLGIMAYFYQRATGLIWDPRSLADIIALLPCSNSFDAYFETELIPNKSSLQRRLAHASPRLGYWRTNNGLRDIFYCIGEEGAHTRRYSMKAGRAERIPYLSRGIEMPDHDLEAASPRLSITTNIKRTPRYNPYSSRYQYIPWYLEASPVLLWPLTAFFLLLALLVVSSLPSIAFSNGFPPRVPAAPNSAGFSPANLLYSFVPSMLGILIYSSFRSLSMMVYRLTPWNAMSLTSGAIASESLLTDYTASFPLLSALANKHRLVALLSVLSFLNILLPVLAGGLFFPIELLPSTNVVMLPNLPAFYVIIVVLILSLIGLVYVMMHFISGKTGYHLPHPVSCLAEVLSFLYASDIAQDAAFHEVKSKADLQARLVGRRERTIGGTVREEVRYGFGIFKGKDGEIHIGVRRLRREGLQSEGDGSVVKG